MSQWSPYEAQIVRLLLETKLSGLAIHDALQVGMGCTRSLAWLYVLLHRMEKDGHLCSVWGEERPPERGSLPRRYYTATRLGMQTLALMDQWRKAQAQ